MFGSAVPQDRAIAPLGGNLRHHRELLKDLFVTGDNGFGRGQFRLQALPCRDRYRQFLCYLEIFREQLRDPFVFCSCLAQWERS